MDAVLTCMVDEKLGPGAINARFIQLIKETCTCDGAAAVRSPGIALSYALKALAVAPGTPVMISALAPLWQYTTLESLGYVPLVLDVDEATGVVNADIVSLGMVAGGKVLVLHETNGILPDMDALCALNVPIVEDISQSVGASLMSHDENGTPHREKRTGTFGQYAILGLEEHDVITAGGGAVVMAAHRRDWQLLKQYTDAAPLIDLLPDLNSALGWVQLKEYGRNEAVRKELFQLYHRACAQGRHMLFLRDMEGGATMANFPVVLSSAYGDVQRYAAKKNIEVRRAFEYSVVAGGPEERCVRCIHAKSLYLRTALFPLYPRLSPAQAAQIVKVLSSLP